MSGIMNVLVGSNTFGTFVPVTRTYQNGLSGIETIPAGASSCLIELWGASGGGGQGDANPCTGQDGSGGGSGAYARSASFAVTGGLTINYTSGAAGLNPGTGFGDSGSGGGNSSVSAGTQALATIVAGGGGGGAGSGGPGGAAGVVGAGGAVQTPGNAGIVSGNGGAAIVGLNGTGAAGANGNNAGHLTVRNGGAGLIIFKYA